MISTRGISDAIFMISPTTFTASLPAIFFNDCFQFVWQYVCWRRYSSNITVPFPFYHFIPLIPLSALDVGDSTASASPPTLSLHYSPPYNHSPAPTLRHRSTAFVYIVHNMLQNLSGMFLSSYELCAFAVNEWSFPNFTAKSFISMYAICFP